MSDKNKKIIHQNTLSKLNLKEEYTDYHLGYYLKNEFKSEGYFCAAFVEDLKWKEIYKQHAVNFDTILVEPLSTPDLSLDYLPSKKYARIIVSSLKEMSNSSSSAINMAKSKYLKYLTHFYQINPLNEPEIPFGILYRDPIELEKFIDLCETKWLNNFNAAEEIIKLNDIRFLISCVKQEKINLNPANRWFISLTLAKLRIKEENKKQGIEDWESWIAKNKEKIILKNLAYLLFIAEEKEKEIALKYLKELSGEEFSSPLDWFNYSVNMYSH